MKGWLNIVGLGFGLAIGAGLIYLFIVDETAWIIFLALGMFVLGGVVMALALLVLNRQWTHAVFGDGQPPRVNNSFRMPVYPPYSFPPAPQGYLPEPRPDPYTFQVVENPQVVSALTDDSPMA